MHQEGSDYSIFGQLKWNVIDTIELSGGGRYSHEDKKYMLIGPSVGVQNPPLVPQRSWDNFSPEATIAWRPTQDLTVFGSYKRGFLSGGFTVTGGVYDQQLTSGFEGGIKAQFFDNTVRANLEFYDYDTKGLQVSVLEGIIIHTLNAGRSSTRGVDFDVAWNTPIEGVSLQGAVGYDKAQYENFTTGCYMGQTIADGCNLAPNSTGVFGLQSLAGRQLDHAPTWTSNASAVYEHSIGAGHLIQLSVDAAYTSSFYTTSDEPPASLEDGYWLFDGGMHFSDNNKTWEVALLGRNLANKYYYTGSGEAFNTGQGGGTKGPLVPADLTAVVSRGREVILRVSKKFE
jgi:iron complex outermembrane receptor protein